MTRPGGRASPASHRPPATTLDAFSRGDPLASIGLPDRNRAHTAYLLTGAAVVIALMAAQDATRADVVFGLSYLAPVTLTVWYAGRVGGMALASLAAIGPSLLRVVHGPHVAPLPLVLVSASTLGLYWLVCALVDAGRQRRDLDARRAFVDPATSLPNIRFLRSILAQLVSSYEAGAPTLTLVRLQLRAGGPEPLPDDVRRAAIAALRRAARDGDLVASLDTNELALLLSRPDTTEAVRLVSELSREVAELSRGLAITVGAGAVTFASAPIDADEVLSLAARALARARQAREGGVRHEVVYAPDLLSRRSGK